MKRLRKIGIIAMFLGVIAFTTSSCATILEILEAVAEDSKEDSSKNTDTKDETEGTTTTKDKTKGGGEPYNPF